MISMSYGYTVGAMQNWKELCRNILSEWESGMLLALFSDLKQISHISLIVNQSRTVVENLIRLGQKYSIIKLSGRKCKLTQRDNRFIYHIDWETARGSNFLVTYL